MVVKKLIDNFFRQFGDEEEFCNKVVFRQIFFIDLRFFNSALIRDGFKVGGREPVVMERLSIERIIEDISLQIFFSTVVGTGLRSQYDSDD